VRGRAARRIAAGLTLALGHVLASGAARAQIVVARPSAPIDVAAPPGAPRVAVQVVLQLVIDREGGVESVVPVSRAPSDAPDVFVVAAVRAVKAARFTPSTRDGQPIRSRIDYVVSFPAPAPAPASVPAPAPAPASVPARAPASVPARAPASVPAPAPASTPLSRNEPDEDYAQVVQVRGVGWSSPRGLGDVRIKREMLEASPRQQTSEMLSAAPGFFVDHEDGEGIGNDVYLRGFDLDHGSGIEMRLGSIPINIPTHIQGQGYADANFIIPEVLRSVRVLEGPYDPRQGDAAIVGSAIFDLGVAERGYQLRASYGSFNQARVVGIAAPAGADEETFAAFSLRRSDGFGQNRASQSASINAQVAIDLGARDRLRLVATAYGAQASLAGVVRQDDVDAGRIGFYDAYPYFAQNQGVRSSRVIAGADFDHVAASGSRFEAAPWFMWTDFRARQNFTGDLESSQIDPAVSGLGDLFETTNRESAAGLVSRLHGAPIALGSVGEIVLEPGLQARYGHTDQTRSLLDPTTLAQWDRRVDATLDTLDAGAYLDLDLRLFRRLRLSGGPRADVLAAWVDDRLAGVLPSAPGAVPAAHRDVAGVAVGPRATAELDLAPEIVPIVSYGEGFRSLDVDRLQQGATSYSKVRSVEGGFRMQTPHERYVTTLSVFQTWVENELVFEAAAGGLQTESASIRRGVVGSVVARPLDWLLASSALSITSSTFTTLVPGVSHYVPNIPPILFRADVAARGRVGWLRGWPLVGRLGVGYTFLSGRHLTDQVIGPSSHALNARAALRWRFIEVGVDGYNLLDLRYADDAQAYVSNWSLRPGQQPASFATHLVAAPPLTLVGTVALYF
jgi:hypothetical protein